MPLTIRRVATADKIMVPAHAAFSGIVGALWIGQSPQRLASPSLSSLADLISLENAGYVLLGQGLLIGAAMLARNRDVAAAALGAGVFVYLGLGYLMADATGQPGASYSAPLWPIYVAVGHLATVMSLALDRPDDTSGKAHP